MYKCKCGREFNTTSGYAGHCSHCPVHLGHLASDRFGDTRAWSRGKNKHTDRRIAESAARQKERIAAGELEPPFRGKKHTEETRQKMSQSAQKVAKDRRNGWKCGDSHIQNKYEEFTAQFLSQAGIDFRAEVTIPRSAFGKKGSYYQFDFLVENRIDLEIDGSVHLSPEQQEHDKERDSCVRQKYQIYRIQHQNNLELLKIELAKFVNMLRMP